MPEFGEDFDALPKKVRVQAELSAEWLVSAIAEEAMLRGEPLSAPDVWILRHPVWEFDDDIRDHVIDLNNRAVNLVRQRILRQTAEGYPTIQIRAGLWVPADLEEHYETIFETEMPWFLSTIMQSVFLGNSIAGEKRQWTPKNSPPYVSAHSEAPVAAANYPAPSRKPGKFSLALKIIFYSAGALLVFFLLISVTVTTAMSSQDSSADYEDTSSEYVEEDVTPVEEEPVDVGATIPGDYWDDGEFAWQWVSAVECPPVKGCTQVRIFSKFDCPYEVWVDYEVENSMGVPYQRATAIPPMTRGATSIATLITDSIIDGNISMIGIRCGQTG